MFLCRAISAAVNAHGGQAGDVGAPRLPAIIRSASPPEPIDMIRDHTSSELLYRGYIHGTRPLCPCVPR
jgi:hypothetical protein